MVKGGAVEDVLVLRVAWLWPVRGFFLRTIYPIDDRSLPRVFEEKPSVYLGRYTPGLDVVEGWLIQKNKAGLKVQYLYRVHWSSGQPQVEISLADIRKGYGFSDRDFKSSRNSPIRDLKGLPENQAKDARAFAARIATHIRSGYIEDVDFLVKRASQFAVKLAEDKSARTECTIFRDGDWLITQRTLFNGRIYLSAECMERSEEFDKAISDLSARYQKYRETDALESERRLKDVEHCDENDY